MYQPTTRNIHSILKSHRFYYAIIGLLILQAAWLAVTARYPQAFDENYHLGLIQLHVGRLLPFFTSQPPDSLVYGAVSRDPSYLYHYLMSFPYQILTHVTDSFTTQIIGLRFINITIFVSGLVVYRKVFDELGISTALRNVVMMFFVLTPGVVMLAAQINYDNLMFVTTGLLFLVAIRYVHAVEAYGVSASFGTKIPVLFVFQILLVAIIGSLVKFPFLPLAVAVIGTLLFVTIRRQRATGLKAQSMFKVPRRSLTIVYVTLCVVFGFLFIERYGVNLILYHDPVPACDKVLSVNECLSYAPWARDYLFAATYPRPTTQGIAAYPVVWVHRMVYETMFVITSYIYAPTGTVTYVPYPPLTIANYTAWTIVVVAGGAAIYNIRRFGRFQGSMALAVLLFSIGVYSAVLFVQNLQMYLHSGEAVAIHGRYFVPFYPVLFMVLAVAAGWLLTYFNLSRYKIALTVITVLLFLQGGGITTWVIKSNAEWYWQFSPLALQANQYAQNILKYLIL